MTVSDSSRGPLKFILGVVFLILLVGLTIFFVSKDSQVEPEKNLHEVVQEDPIFTTSYISAAKVVESFTQATDPKERLQWCRNQEKTAQMLASFPEQALSEVPTELKSLGNAVVDTGLFLNRYMANFANGDRRLLVLVETEEGPRVDWECYARHSSAEWSSILQGAEKEAVVRVFIAPSTYYNYRFRDERKWLSFTLTSPDIDKSIAAYCARRSEVAELLKRLKRGQRVTLKLKLDESIPDTRQCEISEVMAIGWSVADEKPSYNPSRFIK